MNFAEELSKTKIIAVTEISSQEDALNTARALLDGGINAIEIAFRDKDAVSKNEAAISKIRTAFPQMLVAGATITSPVLAQKAINAGAQFLFSAGFNPQTVEYCVKNRIQIFPGVATPGEIEQAMNFGLTDLKLFPVHLIGKTEILKTLSGPYPNIRFIVSGGINTENALEYLTQKNVLALSGSWVSPKKLVAEKNFQEITKLARQAASAVNKNRES